MRLLLSATSPYARKAHVALLEKGVAFEPVFLLASDPTVAAANPLGKIPALVCADGAVVYDSPVIVQYLEVVAPNPALYPADPLARIDALRWEALGDGVCDAVVARMMESRRPAERQDPGSMAHQAGKVTRGLAAMEQTLGDREYAVGGAFSLADIVIACTIGYADLRAPELLEPFGALRARYNGMLARPSLAATVPPR